MSVTEGQVEQAEELLQNDYNVWVGKHTVTAQAQAALAAAQAAETPYVAQVVSDAQASLTKLVSFMVPLLQAVGADPTATLTPIFQAALSSPS